MTDPSKKKLVLDLDDTIIHTVVLHRLDHDNIRKYSCYQNMLVQYESDFYRNIVFFRPHVFDFIRKIADIYDLYVYTHGTELYCKIVISMLTNLMQFNPFKKMYWRVGNNVATKNLEFLGLSADDTVIIDDNHRVWHLTPNNVIVIKPFLGPDNSEYILDTELIKIFDILKEIHAGCETFTDSIAEIVKVKNNEYQKSRSCVFESDFSRFDSLIDEVLSKSNNDDDKSKTNDNESVIDKIFKDVEASSTLEGDDADKYWREYWERYEHSCLS